MAKEVIMPKFGFNQESAQIIRWLKKAGDVVEKGDPIAEVTTDKVDMEVEAPASGVLDGIRYQEGETVAVTKIIAYIRQPDEQLPEQTADLGSAPAAPKPPMPPPILTSASPPRVTPVAARMAQEHGVDLSQVMGTGPGSRVTRRDVERYLAASQEPHKVRATPAARRLSRELAIDLRAVTGSGPKGRVQGSDILTAQKTQAAPPPVAPLLPEETLEVIPLRGMRRTIAQRMQASAQQAPHITFDLSADVTAAEDFRRRANARLPEGQPRVSFTAVLAKVCAWALQHHPLMNARLHGEEIQVLAPINIGIAVALDEGLIVPVVRDVNQKSVMQIAAEIADLAKRAHTGALRPDDVTGGTFTISNLGMFGVERFTAIINPPETAILAVGRAKKQVIVGEDDEILIRPIAQLTLSADHRVVDGAIVARFLNDLHVGLEQIDTLLM